MALFSSFKKKKPFDATVLGIAKNTVFGLPKATLGVAKDIGQGISRNIASAGLTVAKKLGGVDEIQADDIKSPFRQELFRNFFGREPIKAIEDRIADAEIKIKDSPFAQKTGADKFALPLAFGGVFGMTALDLTPFGSLEKNAVKALARETSELGVKKILLSMKVPDEIATRFAPDLAEVKTIEATQDILDNMKGILGVKHAQEVNLAKGVVEGDPAQTLKNVEARVGVKTAPTQAVGSRYVESPIKGVFEDTKTGMMVTKETIVDATKVDSLTLEARKYKSAEEFVGTQKPIYHGTPAKFDKFDTNKMEGGQAWFSDSVEDITSGRAGAVQGAGQKLNLMERYIRPGLKFADEKTARQLYTDQLIAEGYAGKVVKQDRATWYSLFEPNKDLLTKSQLTDIWERANPSVKTTPKVEPPVGKGAPATAQADQLLESLPVPLRKEASSLIDIVAQRQTDVKTKVNVIDYLRTPDRVLEKIGFAKESKMIREGYERYIKELPKNIDKITAWSKEVPKSSAKTIFQYLDGEKVSLTDKELKVAGEMKTWLAEWADRLKLPKDNRISNYITHIFDRELIAKEFDEDLAKLITDRIPGSVYDPFVLERLGKKGYKQNVFEALDAYVKRATRKVNMDDALQAIQSKAGTTLDMSNIEASQFKYIQRYVSGVNMRPTELDSLLDNTIKSVVGYRYGQRPVTYLTKVLRQMTYRGMLGLNPGSALRNISQGINTYAVLGEKYTAIGYAKLLSRGALREAAEEGIFSPGFIQDRNLSSTRKALEKIDKGLFFFFEGAERINRVAAYFGAKSKALAQGKSPQEAIDFGKSVVRKTQFAFGSIDTPVAVQSDIVKTIAQFQNFTLKQTEFLAEMVKDKNFVGLLRYGVAGMVFINTIGRAFGMEPKELIPSFRFGIPPSLKFPAEVVKAGLNTPTKYGQTRSLKQKAQDVGKSALGLIPGGIQARKTIQGMQAFKKGKDTTPTGRTRFEVPQTLEKFLQSAIFGKSSLPEAKEYYDGLGKPAKDKPLFGSFK